MRRKFASLVTGLLLLGGAGASNASIIMNWTDVGGDLILSIDGTWSDWESTTVMTERDDILFGANSTTPWYFDLSRDGFGTTNSSGAPTGSSALLDVVSGSGSVTAPDTTFAPVVAGTRYNVEYLNLGGFLALTAGVGSTEEFFVSDTFNLGSSFSLTAGTRVFGNSNFPNGETLTMNFRPSSVPPAPVSEPSIALLMATGLLCMGLRQRRRRTR